MRTLYLDCFSGISGDMTVGALCDLGAKPSALEWELAKLDLGDYHMHFEKQSRQGIHGIKFSIHEGATHRHAAQDHEHCEPHAHGEGLTQSPPSFAKENEMRTQDLGEPLRTLRDANAGEHEHEHVHGRSYAEIRDLIAASALSEFVKERAQNIFKRIAVAEGKIHGVPVETVGFHEVGALDSIADIVCVCIAIEQLGKPRVVVSHLREGRGWIDCAHGRFPLPAPATLEILRGIEIEQTDEPFESITPTGAAIAAEFAESFGLMPAMKIDRVGYGVGTRELEERPNVLRAVLGETDSVNATGYEADKVIELETNLDDLSPELTAAAAERLLSLGALDVTLTPVQMKKNRPGVALSVLCDAAMEAKLIDAILTETSAFGLRRSEKKRVKLGRRFEKVQTPFGEVTVKLGLRGETVVQVAPEYESCRALSEKSGQPLRAIYQAATAAALPS